MCDCRAVQPSCSPRRPPAYSCCRGDSRFFRDLHACSIQSDLYSFTPALHTHWTQLRALPLSMGRGVPPKQKVKGHTPAQMCRVMRQDPRSPECKTCRSLRHASRSVPKNPRNHLAHVMIGELVVRSARMHQLGGNGGASACGRGGGDRAWDRDGRERARRASGSRRRSPEVPRLVALE